MLNISALNVQIWLIYIWRREMWNVRDLTGKLKWLNLPVEVMTGWGTSPSVKWARGTCGQIDCPHQSEKPSPGTGLTTSDRIEPLLVANSNSCKYYSSSFIESLSLSVTIRLGNVIHLFIGFKLIQGLKVLYQVCSQLEAFQPYYH